MKRILLLALTLILATPAFANDVTVQRINDRRTSGSFSQLGIYLELPKIKSAEVAASRVVVTAAVDETGRDLIDRENAVEPQLETNHLVSDVSGPRPMTVSMNLKNPDRKATKLKEVRGEIELYMPAKDPNSVAEVPKFMSFAGKALSHKALKANGVEIAILSAAQLEAERKKFGEAKRKEYAGYGYEGENLDQAVLNHTQSLWQLSESEVAVRIKDPNQRIQDITYIDAKGEIQRGSIRDDEGLQILSAWAPVKPDWKMRVNMRTQKSVVKQAFALKDVALP